MEVKHAFHTKYLIVKKSKETVYFFSYTLDLSTTETIWPKCCGNFCHWLFWFSQWRSYLEKCQGKQLFTLRQSGWVKLFRFRGLDFIPTWNKCRHVNNIRVECRAGQLNAILSTVQNWLKPVAGLVSYVIVKLLICVFLKERWGILCVNENCTRTAL